LLPPADSEKKVATSPNENVSQPDEIADTPLSPQIDVGDHNLAESTEEISAEFDPILQSSQIGECQERPTIDAHSPEQLENNLQELDNCLLEEDEEEKQNS